MSEKHSAADIEASRKRLNIPDDYQWSECAAGCGDIVWHPPLSVLQAATMPFVITCSGTCAAEALNNRGYVSTNGFTKTNEKEN